MHDETQRLAITLGLLLLIGGVLIGSQLIGVWLTFGISTSIIVGVYAGTQVKYEIKVRRFIRRMRHW